jgi:hypothetical protein
VEKTELIEMGSFKDSDSQVHVIPGILGVASGTMNQVSDGTPLIEQIMPMESRETKQKCPGF